MESMNTNAILYKKMKEEYSSESNTNNFAVASELTVTITLNEYRELIKSGVKAEQNIYEEFKRRRELEAKIEALEKENNELRLENAELAKKVEDAMSKCSTGEEK